MVCTRSDGFTVAVAADRGRYVCKRGTVAYVTSHHTELPFKCSNILSCTACPCLSSVLRVALGSRYCRATALSSVPMPVTSLASQFGFDTVQYSISRSSIAVQVTSHS